MNNVKIGKFIAKLRKAKGLTQQQLGDLVGVGGKSVSKWERGINMPDVSIINEVSKILGITSDELLKGEFDKKSTNEEYKKKIKQRKITALLFILIFLSSLIITFLFYYFKNDTHKYWLTSENKDFNIYGYIEYNKKDYTISINKLYCQLEECKTKYIKNIDYALSINNTLVYRSVKNSQFDEVIVINKYLDNNEILLTNQFQNDFINYDDLKNINSAQIIIEGFDIEDTTYKYTINLKINDKKE